MQAEASNFKSQTDPSQLLQDGLRHHQAGRFDDAIAAYRRLIELDPSAAEAWNNLGNALGDAGDIQAALEAYRAAIKLNPDLDRAYSNLGVTLRDAGRSNEAVVALRRATEINPDSSIAWDNLGITLREQGELESSVMAHDRAAALDPASPVIQSNRSIALRAAGRLKDAIAAASNAITIRPDYAEAHNNIGVALAEDGRSAEAISAYRRAILLRPGYAHAYTNLAVSLADMGEFDGCLALCQKAVELEPANAFAHFNLAVILLLLGDFKNGFAEYEWRWKCRGLLPQKHFSQPRWKGEPLEGRTLLVHAEQGLGDSIHFARYVPEVAKMGGRLVLECQPQLVRLMRSLAAIEQIIAIGDPLPPFDLHCGIASLPGALGTTIETIPCAVPYVHPRARDEERWRDCLAAIAPPGDRPRIGLAWAGGSAHKSDRHRSLHLCQLMPLVSERAIFISLQKGPAAGQIAQGLPLIDWTDELFDLADTAALISQLDLVISVDTAIAHLAGALGKPTWTLLGFNPDWRWMLNRTDSPWYPMMRLFRQREPGNWDELIGRVAQEMHFWPQLRTDAHK